MDRNADQSSKPPTNAYTNVLAKVGCFKPNRDSVDARIINEITTGTTATGGNNGIMTYPTDVAAAGRPWPSGTPPTDTDHDGMPDDWENAWSDHNNAADRNSYTLSSHLHQSRGLPERTGRVLSLFGAFVRDGGALNRCATLECCDMNIQPTYFDAASSSNTSVSWT